MNTKLDTTTLKNMNKDDKVELLKQIEEEIEELKKQNKEFTKAILKQKEQIDMKIFL